MNHRNAKNAVQNCASFLIRDHQKTGVPNADPIIWESEVVDSMIDWYSNHIGGESQIRKGESYVYEYEYDNNPNFDETQYASDHWDEFLSDPENIDDFPENIFDAQLY